MRSAIELDLILGAHKIDDDREATQLRLRTDEYYIHPGYDSFQLLNDIAVVRLPRRVRFTDAIAPVCLPTRTTRDPPPGAVFVLAGWGRVSDRKWLPIPTSI